MYQELYRQSITDRDEFWRNQIQNIDWVKEPEQVVAEDRSGLFHWFPDGKLNTCFNALDRHVLSGAGERPCLIYDSPVTGTKETYTYSQMLSRVEKLAGGLSAHGVGRGDRVLIYMPMIPEAVVAMLACSRIGAVHTVVFGGFAAQELANRIDDAAPKAILTASCGIEQSRIVAYKPLLDKALEIAHAAPTWVVIKQRKELEVELTRANEFSWDDFEEQGRPGECVPVDANDPLYILYTSGTTGAPKGVVRDNGGHAVALTWSMKNIFNISAGDVFWAASDVGWVVGHSYIVYGPLLAGATTVLYEGKPVGTPDAGAFWRVVEEHQVKALFAAPTALRAIRRLDPGGLLPKDYDINSLEVLFAAGERLDIPTFDWASQALRVPVIDNWWQTETGWPIAANPIGLGRMQIKPGSPTVPMPGFEVRVLDDLGAEVEDGQEGNICLKLPLPPGTLTTIYKAPQRFRDSYLQTFPGYFSTGDRGHLDEDGYIFIHGRSDDVINVAGHRLSGGGIEEVIATHPAVAECAVVGALDELKGERPVGVVVLRDREAVAGARVSEELIALVRERIGPVADFKRIEIVDALPKTRSGKVLRSSIREVINGQEPEAPSTIEDAGVLRSLANRLLPTNMA